jgi:hypothetical protein
METFSQEAMPAGRSLAAPRIGIRIFEWVALVLIVVGARLWLIANYGSSLPILDQWDGEAAFLFKPWLGGTLHWPDLFTPHNEHRIVLSRILALGLLQMNGQWDALLEMAVNALLCGLMALVAGLGLRHIFGHVHRSFICAAVTFWLALPYAHENTLWGFQSAFYFLLLFSITAIWGLGLQRAFSIGWCLGAAAAILACLTMSSGFFAAAAVLGMMGLRSIKQRRISREDVATATVVGVIMIIACAFQPAPPPWHKPLQASSVSAWLAVFGRCLAWPFPQWAVAGWIMYLPIVVLLAWFSLARGPTSENQKLWRQMKLLLGLGLWVILQAAAIAYGRGGDGSMEIASRYMDVLALGALVNLAALILLVSRLPSNSRWRRGTKVLAGFWVVALVAGGLDISYRQIANQSGRLPFLRLAEQDTRGYVATGNPAYLKRPIPYPDPLRLAELLDDVSIRSILPACVRTPLRVKSETDEGSTFVPGGYPSSIVNPSYEQVWGSFSALGAAATGTMESASIHSRLPYLEMELAGYFRPGLNLTLRGDGNNKTVRFIPTSSIDPSWRRGSIAVPAAGFRIIATDQNPRDWFAFREPRELGRFSRYAERLISAGKRLCLGGIALWLSLLAYAGLNKTMNLRRAG